MTKSGTYWLMAELRFLPASREAVTHVLFSNGALGSEELEGRFIAYFTDQPIEPLQQKLAAGLRRITDSGLSIPEQKVQLRRMPEADWHAGWKAYFRPVVIADRLYVRPPWAHGSSALEISAAGELRDLVINPGQAFGTGNHETTRLMLEAIVAREERLPATALDVGTGSAILAIAHVLLRPAARITAVDIDPVALPNARENVARHALDGHIDLVAGSLECLEENARYPLIFANLQKHIILPMLDALCRHLLPGGELLLCGLLLAHEHELRDALVRSPLRILSTAASGEWLRIDTCRES